MDDREPVELAAPLPGGALGARLVFKDNHAVLEEELTGPRTRRRRMDRAEAEAYLAEVARMQAEAARRDAEHAERVAQLRRARAEVQASDITVDCPRCGIPRAFEGRRDVLSAGRPENLHGTGDFIQGLRPGSRTYYEYACPRCGSVEWFRHGPLEHPLDGA